MAVRSINSGAQTASSADDRKGVEVTSDAGRSSRRMTTSTSFIFNSRSGPMPVESRTSTSL